MFLQQVIPLGTWVRQRDLAVESLAGLAHWGPEPGHGEKVATSILLYSTYELFAGKSKEALRESLLFNNGFSFEGGARTEWMLWCERYHDRWTLPTDLCRRSKSWKMLNLLKPCVPFISQTSSCQGRLVAGIKYNPTDVIQSVQIIQTLKVGLE